MSEQAIMAAGASALLAAAAALLSGFGGAVLHVCDRLLGRYISGLTARMKELNLDDAHVALGLRVWAGSLAATALVVGVALRSPLLAGPLLFVLYRFPRTYLARRIARRRVLLRDQMVSGCVALSNATRAGMALAQGLEAVLPETPEPLASEFRHIVADFQRGRPFAACLRNAQARLKLTAFTLFSSAILVCLERGGKVTEALDRIALSLKENQRLERKLESDTAAGRMAVLVLALAPAAFVVGFGMLNPDSTGLLFSTTPGQAVLLVVWALVFAAVKWAQSILSTGGGE